MRPLYPLSIAITSQNVWNMRLKVKKLILLEEEQNVDGTSTSQVLVSSSIQEENELPSLDEIPAEFLPVASQIAREILKQALNSGNDTKVILAYLQKLHASDPTFTFRIAYATDGSISGYVWQTAAMRAGCVKTRTTCCQMLMVHGQSTLDLITGLDSQKISSHSSIHTQTKST